MADFTQSFLGGVQAGQQRLRMQREEEQRQEENRLKKMMLKHQMDRLKIEDEVRARKIAIEEGEGQKNFDQPPVPPSPQMMGQAAIGGVQTPPPLVPTAQPPATVPVNIPAAMGLPAETRMYPTRTGEQKSILDKFNREQESKQALSQVMVPPGDPSGLPPGLIDREIYTGRMRQVELNQRLDQQAENIAAQIAASQARTEAMIAAGDRRAAANNAAAERRLYLQGKAIESTKPEAAESESFIKQPGFASLPPPQKTEAVKMNGLISMAQSYRDLVEDLVGPSGIQLTGPEAAVISGLHAKLMFEGAQGWGQGALQKPDLEQMQKTFYDPSGLTSVFSTLIRGKKEGRIKAMDAVIKDLELKMRDSYGLTPSARAVGWNPKTPASQPAAPTAKPTSRFKIEVEG